jgi:hypothetical protein
MSILPYSFCRDDTEKKTLRHGFILGMMTASVLLIPLLFIGGFLLLNAVAARSPSYAVESPPVSEDMMIPYSIDPQTENKIVPTDQVIQAVPIGQEQIAQRAVPQGNVTARIPLPSMGSVSPIVQQATAIAAQYPPTAPLGNTEDPSTENTSTNSVLTEGVTFSDRRIAYFGGQDVPTGQTGR